MFVLGQKLFKFVEKKGEAVLVDFMGERQELNFNIRRRKGHTELRAIDTDGFPFGTYSYNPSSFNLKTENNEVLIKDCDENAGIISILEEAAIIESYSEVFDGMFLVKLTEEWEGKIYHC